MSLQYLTRSSLHRLAGLPCRIFLSYGLRVVTREVHLSFFRRLMCPVHAGPFHFPHIADCIYDFCPIPDPCVGLYILLCDVEHTYFHFGLCGRKFVLSAFVVCIHVSAPYAMPIPLCHFPRSSIFPDAYWFAKLFATVGLDINFTDNTFQDFSSEIGLVWQLDG